MKSDREFLDEVWQIVVQTEYEQVQKELAKRMNKQITKKIIVMYISIVLMFIAIQIAIVNIDALSSSGIKYIIAVIFLVVAYMSEVFLFDNKAKGMN